MNRYFFRSSILLVVSFGLLYYSVAWAVLRCPHDGDQSGQQVVRHNHNNDADKKASHYTSSHPVPLNLECVCPDYHTELMAASSSPSQLHRLTLDMTPNINGFFTAQTAPGDGASDVWLRAVFAGSSSGSLPIGLPRYLSLSNLRI